MVIIGEIEGLIMRIHVWCSRIDESSLRQRVRLIDPIFCSVFVSGFLDPDPDFHHGKLFLIDDPSLFLELHDLSFCFCKKASYFIIIIIIMIVAVVLIYHHVLPWQGRPLSQFWVALFVQNILQLLELQHQTFIVMMMVMMMMMIIVMRLLS